MLSAVWREVNADDSILGQIVTARTSVTLRTTNKCLTLYVIKSAFTR